MLAIALGVLIFTLIVMLLVAVILMARARLMPSGEVSIGKVISVPPPASALTAPAASAARVTSRYRITSYNVCYTKLLRIRRRLSEPCSSSRPCVPITIRSAPIARERWSTS